MKSKVYFTENITPENIIEMYKVLNKNLKAKVAVKVHSGEKGNKNYLKPEFLKPMVDYVNGTIVECNTAYEGARNTTEKHKELIKEHDWTKYFKEDDCMSDELIYNYKNVDSVFDNIKELVVNSRNRVYSTLNTEMINLYWNIGKAIMEI